jgi:ATP-dependent Clp protease ATP-binding subunit ClpC
MWQRFTERARRIVFFAQEEASRLGENRVGPEHLLLGLIREPDSVAMRILVDQIGLFPERIRAAVERQAQRGTGNDGRDMQLTPAAKRTIDLAYEEARRLENNYIGTEHLLLGLVAEGEGLAARVLIAQGADLEMLRRHVEAMQGA